VNAALPPLPDAAYVSLSSRLIPGLDGGYTVATLARARLLEDAGAAPVTLLTVDPGTAEAHAEHRAEFVRRGDAASVDRFRNLFDDAVADRSWLRAAAEPGEPTAGVEYRAIQDSTGATIVSIPVVPGDPDWHLTEAAVVVPGAGVLSGFRGLYAAWLRHVVSGLRADDPARVVVVVCESRQLGELIAHWDDPRVRLVHTIHNSHLEPPYDDPEGPIGELWRRWFDVAPWFDAVLWPTAAQRDDVAARFGGHDTYVVVPNAVEPVPVPEPVPVAEPGPTRPEAPGSAPALTGGGVGTERPSTGAPRVIMLNRLAPQKRVDHAIRAWRQVADAVPGAHLDVYGGGPLRVALQELVDGLGLTDAVTLHGHVDDRDAAFAGAALFLASPAYEGQGLSTAEALAHGIPAVSYDVRYGPRETIRDAGVLVPSGDVDALAGAVIALLLDPERRAGLASRARAAAAVLAPDTVRGLLVRAIADAVARPSRRA
jgi:glycosyltransferase involved in cell wall biosynthesis